MGEDNIIKEFQQLHMSGARSKTARLRDLYDHIETLRDRGFSHATIVQAMKKHGLEFDLKTFEVTFYRIRRERAKESVKPLHTSLVTEPEDVLQSHSGNQAGDSGDRCNTSSGTPKQVFSWPNPLHALSRKQAEGDFNHIPKAKFEIDKS